MRTRIWNEITETKHDIEYLRAYSFFQDKVSRIFNVLILVFSSSGVMSWGILDNPKYTGILCSITAGISLIKLISPHFLLSEKETKKLDKYYALLIHHFDKIEKFWYDYEDGQISNNNLTNEFYKLSGSVNEINERYNDLNIIHFRSLIKKAKKHSDEYFNKNFNQK